MKKWISKHIMLFIINLLQTAVYNSLFAGTFLTSFVVVWLKIGKHDIKSNHQKNNRGVVVWLKIGKHDIKRNQMTKYSIVVVWLKIGKHDIKILFC